MFEDQKLPALVINAKYKHLDSLLNLLEAKGHVFVNRARATDSLLHELRRLETFKFHIAIWEDSTLTWSIETPKIEYGNSKIPTTTYKALKTMRTLGIIE